MPPFSSLNSFLFITSSLFPFVVVIVVTGITWISHRDNFFCSPERYNAHVVKSVQEREVVSFSSRHFRMSEKCIVCNITGGYMKEHGEVLLDCFSAPNTIKMMMV
jgi:hypothetical protein